MAQNHQKEIPRMRMNISVIYCSKPASLSYYRPPCTLARNKSPSATTTIVWEDEIDGRQITQLEMRVSSVDLDGGETIEEESSLHRLYC
jgi:hypothetical protein